MNEEYIKQYGVTRATLDRILKEAERKNTALRPEKQAKEAVLASLSQEEVKMYYLAKRVNALCSAGLFLSLLFGFFAFIGQSFGWSGLAVVAGVVSIATRRRFNRRHVELVESKISERATSIRRTVFQELLRERIEYERFYASPEWDIVREKFLKGQRKINGGYICNYCHNPVWPDDLTVDHFKPRSKFPNLALEISNLRIAHRRCNSSKGDTIISN